MAAKDPRRLATARKRGLVFSGVEEARDQQEWAETEPYEWQELQREDDFYAEWSEQLEQS